MIPSPFEYELADSVEQAVELLGSREGAKVLAGGHSLLPMMRLRIARPSLLVDVGLLRDLSYVREDGDRLLIGRCPSPRVQANARAVAAFPTAVARGARAGRWRRRCTGW